MLDLVICSSIYLYKYSVTVSYVIWHAETKHARTHAVCHPILHDVTSTYTTMLLAKPQLNLYATN